MSDRHKADHSGWDASERTGHTDCERIAGDLRAETDLPKKIDRSQKRQCLQLEELHPIKIASSVIG